MAFSPTNINNDNICNSEKHVPLAPNILPNRSSPEQSSTLLSSIIDDASFATPIMPTSTPQSATPGLPSIQNSSAGPTQSILTGLTIKDSTNFSPTSSSYKAARDSVLSQMITTQNIVTPVTVARKNVKTGGRRGRGGRALTSRDEGQKNGAQAIDAENAIGTTGDAPGRAKGKARSRGGGKLKARSSNGLPRGTKRNRAQSEDEAQSRNDGSDSSETFTPLPAQSRSGRRIFQASTFAPVVIDLEANIEPKRSPTKGTAATATAGQGKKGKRPKGKSGDASVCKNCGRGHSPMSNMIVFCNGCNTPWHQHCHDEPISDDVVRIEEKEWFCADCEVLKEERVQLEGKVSAEGMSLVEVWHQFFFCLRTFSIIVCIMHHLIVPILQRRRYLQALPQPHLVSLLLHATSLHPTLPIRSAPDPAPVFDPTAEDEVHRLYAESAPLPYPKAGNGVPLPPENEDLALLIDKDMATFSHVWNWNASNLFGTEQMNEEKGRQWERSAMNAGS